MAHPWAVEKAPQQGGTPPDDPPSPTPFQRGGRGTHTGQWSRRLGVGETKGDNKPGVERTAPRKGTEKWCKSPGQNTYTRIGQGRAGGKDIRAVLQR